MTTKFYYAENAGGREIGGEVFEVYEIFGGTALGVFKAQTDGQIAALDQAAADPRQGVTVISEAEYDAALKKKAPSYSIFPTSNHRTIPQVAIKGAGAEVVQGETPAVLTEAKQLETVESALTHEEVLPVDDKPNPKPKAKAK